VNAEHHNRRRGTLRRAATIVAAWLAGGLLVVGVLSAGGVLDGGSPAAVTTVKEASATTPIADTSTAGTGAEALYESASPGVVTIKSVISGGAESGASPFGAEPEQGESTATGSGFIVDQEGTVVTAAHVVDEASAVKVILQDGTVRSAEVLGVDDATDVAVIRFDPEGIELQPLELGDSSSLKVGAAVAAIGAPFEYAWSFSTGIVSGLDRTIEAPNGFTVSHAIQTDAAVNPGNSGGPLLDSGGDVIGVVDQIATDGSADQSSGVGFAVPSDLVASELEALEAGESVEHAYLGVSTGTASGATAGAQVAEVVPGSPAAEAGLRQGDLITALDGDPIASTEDLVAAIAAHEPDEKVTLKVDRDSESISIEARLGTQPAESGAASSFGE
jgi:S1-C subfamily serine protease